MIQDVAEFRRTGVASRWVAELNIPVEAWRAAMCRVARQDRARVRTFVIPFTRTGPDAEHGRMVFAVRIDPPPDQIVGHGSHVRWWRVDELGMSFHRWRAALHRTARREQVKIHTFLVPGRRVARDASDQLVYLVWAPEPVVSTLATPSPPLHAPRPVTDLARYAATRRPAVESRRDVEGTEC